MRRTVNFGKIISTIISLFIVSSVFSGVYAEADSFTYCKVTYLAGNVENINGSSEAIFNKIINTSFTTADSSRFSRNGYVIDSWTLASTGEKVGAGTSYFMPNYDITFIANWVPATYSVTFTGKGGKTASGSSNIYSEATYGTVITLPENEFVYGSYSFAGWKYDNVLYNPGDSFEIPAIASGKKIIFAAVWEMRSVPVETTAPEITYPETTTTIVDSSGFEKTFEINERLDYLDTERNMYNISLSEMLEYGEIDKFEINLRSSMGNIGQVSLAISTVLDGQWYQLDCNDTYNSNRCTINFADKETCNRLDGDYIRIGYWYGSTIPLYIDSVTVTYKEKAPVTEEITTTIPEEIPTEETTTTIVTTVENTPSETTVVIIDDSQYSKVVELNRRLSRNDTITFSNNDVAGRNQIVESIEVKVRFENYASNNYAFSVSATGKDNICKQFNYNGMCEEESIILSAVIPEDSQAYVNTDDLIAIGYWWGDAEYVVVESIKVNYRIEIGDYNRDGVVGSDDVGALRKYMVGIDVYGYDVNFESADVNGDGVVNVYDCVSLTRLFN